jgi:thioredoxin 1
MLRRSFLVAGIAAVAVRPGAGRAAVVWQSYNADGFAADQAAGKTILAAVHADWCPTCKQQAPILKGALGEAALAGVVTVRVNFDTDKDFLTAHRVAQQSTILVSKGDREVARVIAETDPERLRAFVTGNAAA